MRPPEQLANFKFLELGNAQKSSKSAGTPRSV